MRCDHFEAGECRSCTLLDVPQPIQVETAQQQIADLLAPYTAPGRSVWGPPIRSASSRFRAKAKMVVSGTTMQPVLGIAPDAEDPDRRRSGGGTGRTGGVDLSDCPLYPAPVEPLLAGVRALIRRAQVPPYDVSRRRGELKHAIVTVSPDEEMMLRLVLRSESALPRLREHLPSLLADAPALRVVSANIHPEHTARLEGPTEIHLAGDGFLPIHLADAGITLRARPRSFLQTNTAVAARLYAQAASWVDRIEHDRAEQDIAGPLRIWDLYCGIGGFALHCAPTIRADGGRPVREVTGVEVSEEAITSAREAAEAAGLAAVFHSEDATGWAIREAQRADRPDVVIVNPPRRGIGGRLARWVQGSGVPHVLYSSCHPATLARDLAAMPGYRIEAARLVEMFPHTRHDEVLVRLRRRDEA